VGFVGGLLRPTLEPKWLGHALETLHHRGPDAVGKWVAPDGRCFLGHTRLSLHIGPSGSWQATAGERMLETRRAGPISAPGDGRRPTDLR